MSEQTIITLVTSLVSVIAVLALVIKMMIDKKASNSSGKKSYNNPVNLQSFITDCTREHAEQTGLLISIKETLARIEEKITK